MINVVSYSRASADTRKDEHTVTEQDRVNTQTAKRRGWNLVHQFSDNDKSAMKDGVVRDDFEALLRVLKAGRLPNGTPVHGVVVTADDRLYRRPGDYERFLDVFQSSPDRVYSDKRSVKNLYSEEVESSGLMGAVISRMEVKKTRRRVKDWHRGVAERGELPSVRPAFGWDPAAPEKAHAVHGKAVEKAIIEFIAGKGLNSICLGWQQRGFVTTRGNPWTVDALVVLFKNPRLCGWRILDGGIVRDEDGRPVVGKWEALITSDQWIAVQEIFARRAGKKVNRSGIVGELPQDYREHKYLCTGILRCGKLREDGTYCWAGLRANPRKNGSVGYQCPAKSHGGCGGIARRADLVDLYVSQMTVAKLEERSLRAPKVEPWEGEQELAEYEEQERELRKRWHARAVENDLFFEELSRINRDIKRLKKDQAGHTVKAERANAGLVDIRRRWFSETDDDRLDISQKRLYLREAFHAIIVHPTGKGGGGRAPFNPDLLEPVWRKDEDV
ncbi:recombinase family protein [Sphaerisporangium sp. NPDC049002]|uniref:recombinase family protein n=1 Tax=unclassified Sphaerisporangium TaxID=2630420 RepID=UPI0033DBE2BD